MADSISNSGGIDDEAQRRTLYRAPALEKGLDILELLAVEEEPQTVTAIVQKLGRSTGELFRMIQVLEQRGFLVQTGTGYVLSAKLFQIGLKRPPVRNLIELALPIMRALSQETGQSCHLAFRSLGDMVVVARMESSELVGFSVRIGYRQPLYLTGSGAVLYAFQPDATRAEWEQQFQPPPSKTELKAFRAQAQTTLDQGFIRQASAFNEGVQDLSAPVMRGQRAAAALTVPFSRRKADTRSLQAVIEALVRSAKALSAELTLSDSRA